VGQEALKDLVLELTDLVRSPGGAFRPGVLPRLGSIAWIIRQERWNRLLDAWRAHGTLKKTCSLELGAEFLRVLGGVLQQPFEAGFSQKYPTSFGRADPRGFHAKLRYMVLVVATEPQFIVDQLVVQAFLEEMRPVHEHLFPQEMLLGVPKVDRQVVGLDGPLAVDFVEEQG
jgi:hypothetical protein